MEVNEGIKNETKTHKKKQPAKPTDNGIDK